MYTLSKFSFHFLSPSCCLLFFKNRLLIPLLTSLPESVLFSLSLYLSAKCFSGYMNSQKATMAESRLSEANFMASYYKTNQILKSDNFLYFCTVKCIQIYFGTGREFIYPILSRIKCSLWTGMVCHCLAMKKERT